MKIIYLHQYFTTPEMPGGTRSYEMARRLVQVGHEVHMITTDRNAYQGGVRRGKRWYRSMEAGIVVHWLGVPYSNQMNYRERLRAFSKFALLAGPKSASLQGDVIFATSTPLTIARPAVYAAQKNKIPMVFEVRDLWPRVPVAVGAIKNPLLIKGAQWLEQYAYRHSAQVVALSPGMKDGIIASGYPAQRVTVIPNSCDLDLFNVGSAPGNCLRQRYNWLQDRPLVIYTGTLGMVNGVDYLVRLAALIQRFDSEIIFVVIGTGREENKVRRLAEELDVLNKNFFMLPGIPKKMIPAWLSAATIATSVVIDIQELWANSANKFFDALASGTPIAINHEGWQADLLRRTGAGLVLDPKDIKKAAQDLLRALLDRRWLRDAGKSALSLAEQQFSRDKLAAQLEQVLLKAATKF